MSRRGKSILGLLVLGTIPLWVDGAVPVGTVVEDFEGYTVSDGSYLDPTTVSQSRWSRNDAGSGPDWEVACCSGTGSIPRDDPFDGSSKHLRLRRANNTPPHHESVLTTDFSLTDMTAGTVSFEVNPSSIGTSGKAFVGGLFDSVTGTHKVIVTFREISANSGNFEVFGNSIGTPLAVSSNPSGGSAPFDRWFRVSMTLQLDGTFDVCIDDIGPTSPTSASGDPARGNILNFVGGLSPAASVDTLRLDVGSGNGGSNDAQPTMLDNIAQEVLVETGGLPVAGVEVIPALKIPFSTLAGADYQPQFCDDLPSGTWIDFGGLIAGNGSAFSVFGSTFDRPHRVYRVVEIVTFTSPPVVEDFESYGVNGNFLDITPLSANWTRNDAGSGPDWLITCCSPNHVTGDNTFDGSAKFLVLDRDNGDPSALSVLNTDFNLGAVLGAPCDNCTVEVEMNPSGVGGSISGESGAFHMSLYDSVSGKDAVRVLYREVTPNSGDFEIWDSSDTLLATGNVPDGAASFDRWYRISVRIRDNATMDVTCTDIGPTNGGSTSGVPARGDVLTLTGVPLTVTSVDTLRLLPGSSNGGSSTFRPTMIDNIAAGSVATVGIPIGVLEVMEAREIRFPSVAGKQYQPQFSDDGGNSWMDLGAKLVGSGGISTFDDLVADRQWRVLDLEGASFHGGFLDRTSTMFSGGLLFNGRAGWGDFNNDGYPDLVDDVNVWRNNGGIGFSHFASIGGNTFADYNNDGLLDLYVYRHVAEIAVYRNNNGTGFTAVGFPAIDAVNDSQGMAWGDWDKDGDTDLYIGAHEWPSNNRPDVEIANNNGTSFSVDWTEPGTPLRTRGVTACDFDHDRDLDIFVCHYRLQPNSLLVNNGSGSFVNMAPSLGASGFQAGHPVSAYAHTIGAAWGDLDNDGDFDLFVANFAHANQPESEFLENLGSGGSYNFVDRASNVQLAYQESFGAPALADYDNDGDLDFWLGKATSAGSPVLYRNEGNWFFTDVTADAGLGGLGLSMQSAWADIDDDGDLDLVTGGKMFVNQGNENHWLKVKVDGINQANVGLDAIGTQVRIDFGGGKILTRQVESGMGSNCSNDLVLHFGLGLHTDSVDLEVRWLNGNTQTIQDVDVDQTVLVQ